MELPGDHMFYDASVIWEPIRLQGLSRDLSTKSAISQFFLARPLAAFLVWFAHKAFLKHHWVCLVNMPILIGAMHNLLPATPILIGAMHNLLPATPVNFTSWIIIVFISGFTMYRYRHDWWQLHNYTLSGALGAGLAFMGCELYLTLEFEKISLNWWGSKLNSCLLASA